MQAQGKRQHARPKAHVVVNPVGWTAVMMLSGHMGAYPDSNIRRHIDVSRIRIWLVLIDRRSPVNRDATQNEAKKDRHIQPVTQRTKKWCFPTTSTPGCSCNVLVEFGSQLGGVDWLIDRHLTAWYWGTQRQR